MKRKIDRDIHRSHISSRQTRLKGWTHIPERSLRLETAAMQKEYQLKNCVDCRFGNGLAGTGYFCCTYIGALVTQPGICLTKQKKEIGEENQNEK